MVRPIPPDKKEIKRRRWLARGRPRPGKRIKSRGLAEKADQAIKRALLKMQRQQEKERRKRERELARLMRQRLGTRRGVGSQLYTADEREIDETDPGYRKRKHQAGSLTGVGVHTAPPCTNSTGLRRRNQVKRLRKLKRVA